MRAGTGERGFFQGHWSKEGAGKAVPTSQCLHHPSLAAADENQLAEAHRDHLSGWSLKECDPPKWDF